MPDTDDSEASRAAPSSLQVSNDASRSDASRSPSPFDPPPDLVTAYEALLKEQFADLSSLGHLPAHPVQEGHSDDEGHDEGAKPMTKAEKQNAKKKRRKERERLAKAAVAGPAGENRQQADDVVGFRLFSSCPVRPVSLAGVEETYPLPANPRHQRYTDDEVSRRREVARDAAVAYPELGGPSTLATRWTRSGQHPRVLAAVDAAEAQAHQNWLVGSLRPHTPDDVCRPTVVRLTEPDHGHGRKKTRRGRAKNLKHRPGPAYWTPEGRGIKGGKSMSTMWGHGLGVAVG